MSRVDRVVADLNTLLSVEELITPSDKDRTHIEVVRSGPLMAVHFDLRRSADGEWWRTTIAVRSIEEQEVLDQLAQATVCVYGDGFELDCGRLGKSLQIETTLRAGCSFNIRLFGSTIEDAEEKKTQMSAVPSGAGWAPRVVRRAGSPQ